MRPARLIRPHILRLISVYASLPFYITLIGHVTRLELAVNIAHISVQRITDAVWRSQQLRDGPCPSVCLSVCRITEKVVNGSE